MKGTYQIYLFALTLVVAIGFFIQRSFNGSGSLYPIENVEHHPWDVRSFDEVLFGGDSLIMTELTTHFHPFFESNPLPNFGNKSAITQSYGIILQTSKVLWIGAQSPMI